MKCSVDLSPFLFFFKCWVTSKQGGRFISAIFLVSFFYSTFYAYSIFKYHPTYLNNTQGPLTLDKVLDRGSLFSSTPPDVRKTRLKMFGSRELIASLETLLLRKLSNSHRLQKGPSFIELMDKKKNEKIESNKTLHIAFVGDSRIRQLFVMFLSLIPDYDRVTHTDKIDLTRSVTIPNNRIGVYSKLMGLFISYHWRSLLLDDRGCDLSGFFYNWLQLDSHPSHLNVTYNYIPTPHPDVLVIGISAHHMVKEHKYHEEEYFEKLRELVPIFQEISKNCQIIWLNQYPTIDFFGIINTPNTDVHAEKIWHYNKKANQILREGGIPVWNSGSPLVEEYIRSCGIHNKRRDNQMKNFFDCIDYIHPGTSVLTDMIQILYNAVLPIFK